MYKLLFIYFILSCYLLSQEKKDTISRPKVGVVLSGGGAKGYAHIAALKVIEEAGIKVDYIGGTSMGAIVGGLYAAGYRPNELDKIMRQFDISSLISQDKKRSEIPLFDKSFKEKYILELPFDNFKLTIPNAFSKGQGPLELLTYLFRPVHDIEDFNKLPIPFVCIATDIESGQEKVFHSGFLPRVVLASGAYPTLLDPVSMDGRLYVDGGIVNNFPVKEVREMGADIIIGVELGDGLLKKEELKSAIDILSQIMSMSIVKKTNEQKKLVDILIKPNLKKYSVTSFDDVEPIYKQGYEAAEAVFDQLQHVAELQNRETSNRKEIKLNDYVLVKKIKINGLKNYNENYIIGKLNIHPPELLKYDDLKTGINKLYASGNFNNIGYKISELDSNNNLLTLDIEENKNKQSVKFGIHYDDIFKTGLLLNFTSQNLLLKNSTFSADLVIGDFIRYSLNYFVDNGYLPSFGFYSKYSGFSRELDIGRLLSNPNHKRINVNFADNINQFYMQSTIKEKFAIGVGIEQQYSRIYTNNYIDLDNDLSSNIEGYFRKLYGYIQFDNRDNANYPRKGLKFDAILKYSFDSNIDNFETNYFINGNLEFNIPLNSFLSYKFFGSFGTFFNRTVLAPQKFLLGGYIEQNILNYTKFYGLHFAYALGNNKLLVGSQVQAKILRNHYASFFINMANITEKSDQLDFTNYNYIGYGISYGYDSPLGPINLLWSYSPNTGQGLFNIGLGYWF